jgi:hypothetical protein
MIDETLFRNVLKAIKDRPESSLDIIDSFSDNQFNSKKGLLRAVEELGILRRDSDVFIMGCWYGSILIPLLSDKVRKIIAMDLDETVIRIGKNRFFKEYDNILWSTGDVFLHPIHELDVHLIINTSCEHMNPMKDWPFWDKVGDNVYFAFQSNDMYQIEGHTNCVSSIEEFKLQMPVGAKLLYENELPDERGTRYTLIGQLNG